ncbi:MAG: RimJ/RimL family protein N-acetyltransferase [Candidatus Latescibacterota bacterium]
MDKLNWQVGVPVTAVEVIAPGRKELVGRYIKLTALEPQADSQLLYPQTHGDNESERIWTYMSYGPFGDAGEMAAWMSECVAASEPLFYVVRECESNRALGMVSFLNIVPGDRRIELGHIWYVAAAQRTRANTEAAYLMLAELFALGYRRAEWKCDGLNEKSRAAAQRLGFTYEGTFRQHIIVKGRNRDTAWFSMLDGEWPEKKRRLEQWLYENEDGRLSLRAM